MANIYKLSITKDAFVNKIVESAMKDLDEFFGIKWTYGRPNILLCKDRKTIVALTGQTGNSVIGWEWNRDIYVLDHANFEKESEHTYNAEKYARLLKHELVHAYTIATIKKQRKCKPDWLWEGLADYLSGYSRHRKQIESFKNFLMFYENDSGKVYEESVFAVEILVEKFGKTKILNLLKQLSTCKGKAEFNKLFDKIYGFKPTYNNFNKLKK